MNHLAREPGRGAAGRAWLGGLALFLVPFGVLAVVHWSWSPSMLAGDYAHYLSHARALVEGRPYGDVGYIYNPAAGLIGPPTLPPGLPLTLAPIVAIDGVHSPLVRLLMLTSVLAFALLAAWRLARDVQPWQAAFGAACAAYVMEGSLATVAPISDPGFAALIWGTIVAVDKEGQWTWRRVVVVAALGFAAIAYRTAGIALIPGLLLYALMQRRRLGTLPFMPAALWLAAGAVALIVGVVNIPFSERMLRGLSNVGQHLSTFQRQYRVASFQALLYPFASNRANDVYHAIAVLPALIGIVLLVKRTRHSFLIAFAVAYALLLFVAPVAEPRYAWPLYPVLGASLALGTTFIVQRLWRSWSPTRAAWAAAVPVSAVLLVALARDARRSPPGAFVRHPDAVALFGWLTQQRDAGQADTSMRVAFFNPRVVTLETRVPAMGIVPRTSPGMLSALRQWRATHFIWQGVGLGDAPNPGRVPCVQRMANRLPELFPDFFTLEYRNATFRVYRVRPGEGVSDTEGEPISWSEC